MKCRAYLLLVFLLPLLAFQQGEDKSPPVSQPETAPDEKKPPLEKVVIVERTFKLELAADPVSRANGLMGREKLEKDRGMLFVYPRSGNRNFWMMNCLIDIDLIFLNSQGRITALHEMKKEAPQGKDETNAQYSRRLKRYPTRRSSQYGIELQKGSIKKLKLKVGQTIKLDFKRLTKLAK